MGGDAHHDGDSLGLGRLDLVPVQAQQDGQEPRIAQGIVHPLRLPRASAEYLPDVQVARIAFQAPRGILDCVDRTMMIIDVEREPHRLA